jgi:DNA-binding response OmpR family regulator
VAQARTWTEFASPVTNKASRPFEGEHIGTTHWEDARHWMSIYADLIEFKRGILDRVRRDITKLPPVAQRAAEADVKIIESQMAGYQKRLDLWYLRVWDLQGLRLDPEGRLILYQRGKAALTVREFQLLQFLLDHPHRCFTVTQILGQAWAEPAHAPEEVRNYVLRLRKILASLEIPCELVNRRGRGYSLEFRDDK